jgi:hypothetical protein
VAGTRTLAGIAFLWALLVLTVVPVCAATSDLGPHDDGTADPCKDCHNTASGNPTLRGWATTPASAPNSWWAKNISNLCYTCHQGGQAAHDMSNNAYANSSHAFQIPDTPPQPDGSPETAVAASKLPYTLAPSAELECTSCHNVHVAANRPFSHRTSFQLLCEACHPGRINNDSATSYPGNLVHPYETHPTRQPFADTLRANIKLEGDIDANFMNATPAAPAYALGGHLNSPEGNTGLFDCQTCHAVHGPTQDMPGVEAYLSVDNNTVMAGRSALCEGCHYGGDAGEQVGSVVGQDQASLPAGEWSDHPIDALNNLSFYPTGVIIPNGAHVPADWSEDGPNGDQGAQQFYPVADGAPVCSSCHDVHGGMQGTPLLRGPGLDVAGAATWTFTYDGWCFTCHITLELVPTGHHSVINNLNTGVGPINSQLSCGDCHTTVASGDNWTAHNGFWGFEVSVSDTDSAVCEACHNPLDPTDLLDPALKGQTFIETGTVFPSSHGTLDRGDASHYLGSDSGEFPGVIPNVGPWLSSGFFSQYGPPGTGGGGEVAPTGVSDDSAAIICESCHNITFNDGRANYATDYTTELTAGWESNLLLEPYQDDPPGPGTGAGPNGVGSALCTGCHTGSGNHHPLTLEIVSLSGLALRTGAGSFADQTAAPVGGGAAPGTFSYPNTNELDCDSCHRPHDAADASTVVGQQHGPLTAPDTEPTYHILEIDGVNHAFTPAVCQECHAK